MRRLEIYGVETTAQKKWYTLIFKIYTLRQILQAVGIVQSDWTSQKSWFDSRQGLFSKASRPAVEQIQPPIQWVPEILSPEKSD
jgi:hypothetical protein